MIKNRFSLLLICSLILILINKPVFSEIVKEIVHLNNYVRLKILEKVYKSDYD